MCHPRWSPGFQVPIHPKLLRASRTRKLHHRTVGVHKLKGPMALLVRLAPWHFDEDHYRHGRGSRAGNGPAATDQSDLPVCLVCLGEVRQDHIDAHNSAGLKGRPPGALLVRISRYPR